MTVFYKYLESVLPLKKMLLSLAMGAVSLMIVLIAGLTSEFVRGETVAARTFSAFSFTTLTAFIVLMSCEEYALYKTKRELEEFVDKAALEETDGESVGK